jgi:putative transposase
MKRRTTFDIEGHAHELTFSTYRRLQVFDDPKSIQIFLYSLAKAKEIHRFELWAFVVMPEHVHLLVYPSTGTTVAQILRAVKQPSANRILNHLRETESALYDKLQVTSNHGKIERRLWQAGGGYDRNVVSEKAARAMVDYIHQNPVRRGLVESPQEWQWSSYSAYAGGMASIPVDLLA